MRPAQQQWLAVPNGLKNRAKMLRDKRYAAACHEASHAIICLRLGQTFNSIRLREEPRKIGSLTGTSLGQFVPTDETVFRNEALKEAQVDLAGLAFEKLLRPHLTFTMLCLFGQAASDYIGAMEWSRYSLYARTSAGAEAEVERFVFKNLFPQVRKQVLKEWNNVSAVGELLVQRAELNQAEVEGILSYTRRAAKAGK